MLLSWLTMLWIHRMTSELSLQKWHWILETAMWHIMVNSRHRLRGFTTSPLSYHHHLVIMICMFASWGITTARRWLTWTTTPRTYGVRDQSYWYLKRATTYGLKLPILLVATLCIQVAITTCSRDFLYKNLNKNMKLSVLKIDCISWFVLYSIYFNYPLCFCFIF